MNPEILIGRSRIQVLIFHAWVWMMVWLIPHVSWGQKVDLIRQENAKPGSEDWQLTRVRADQSGQRSPWIEGYCSRQSVRAGESIEFFLSAQPARACKLEFFRTGFYDGKGARLMATVDRIDLTTQPVPSQAKRISMSVIGRQVTA